MLTVESQCVALIAPQVTHAQVSDVLPIRLLSVVSCLCNNLRPHLTSSAGPRKARLSLEDLQPTFHHQHQRSRSAARQRQRTRMRTGRRVQRLKDSGPFLGALGSPQVSPASVSDRGPDWWDLAVVRIRLAWLALHTLRGRDEPRRRRTDREFILR